ncbi:MAG TPA: hypothetical protein ENN47_03785 [Mesotoga infera]|uniref:Uncharacterized protein n=1 Tax=Mesotoga infera TaxID=1236046 RepID=A0A7C1GS14_9BACT|nr:hypothetical protein [Mesotoga infera]
MPKKLSVPLKEFPITDQVNENWNSQATSYDGILTINEFNGLKGEDSENELFDYIRFERMKASKRGDYYMASVLCKILDWQTSIDEYQDPLTDRMLKNFKMIKFENWQMNAKLLSLDPLRSDRYYKKIDRQIPLGFETERGIKVFRNGSGWTIGNQFQTKKGG